MNVKSCSRKTFTSSTFLINTLKPAWRFSQNKIAKNIFFSKQNFCDISVSLERFIKNNVYEMFNFRKSSLKVWYFSLFKFFNSWLFSSNPNFFRFRNEQLRSSFSQWEIDIFSFSFIQSSYFTLNLENDSFAMRQNRSHCPL